MIYLIFAYFCVSMVGITFMVLTRKNPVHSVLWLLLLFLHVAVVYLFLNAEFLAAVQVIVYAGAILVMFLFTVFLLGAKELPKEKRYIDLWEGRVLVGLALIGVFIGAFSGIHPLWKGKYTIEHIEKIGNTKAVGMTLFNEYALGIALLGVILLVPMIAIAVIARRTNQ